MPSFSKLLFLSLFFAPLIGQTISEKKAALSESKGDLDQDTERFLLEVNRELQEHQERLKKLYREAYELNQKKGDAAVYDSLLDQIKEVRDTITALEENWRQLASQTANVEPYALWHQPETTLEQLVIDYGSQDYVYLIPPEIGQIKLSLGSNLPIPRSSWNEMLELILTQNGVGIKTLNPFMRELYLFQNNRSGLKLITNKREDLLALPPQARAAFLLSPDPSDVKRTYFFLDNFVNNQSSSVQLIGRDILIVADAAELQDLLKLVEFVSATRGEIEYKAIPLAKINPDEMIKILSSIFNPTEVKNTRKKEGEGFVDSNGLKIIKLGGGVKGLFLVGTQDEIRKAERVISQVEGQIGGAREKIIYWYTAKYSDPDELADILYKIYALMSKTGTNMENRQKEFSNAITDAVMESIESKGEAEAAERIAEENIVARDQLPPDLYPTDPYYEGGFPIAPAPVRPADPTTRRKTSNRTNFIVDEKTSAIVMVVEADILPSIKDLIKRLDIPKKMVELEVLLLEKRNRNRTDFGLNLLKIGTCAAQINANCLSFNAPFFPAAGIFDFLLSRKKSHHAPAFDLIYRFLLTQEDFSINSNPTVLAVNQTPAFISIQEEQSINTGVFQVETAKGVTLEDAFKRAQYGTTIKIIPIIHSSEDDEHEPYDSVTLNSDITFDTVVSNIDNRPIVIRRNIKNEARVADGETVILGGLRKKETRDVKETLPFIGEIPGIGKLFSTNDIDDRASEMYIFITPRIVRDPACDLEWIRQEEMLRRPGDIPEFAACLVEAQQEEQTRAFKLWMQVLFGRPEDRLYSPGWHNDDTCGQACGVYDGR